VTRTVHQAALAALAEDRIDLRYKGLSPTVPDESLAALAARRPLLVDAGFSFPLLTIDRTAVEHNITALGDWCRERDVLLAPHGKSTMSPELHAWQLAAGAWALTAATVHEVAVYRYFGIPRVMLANQLVDDNAVRWLAEELANDADFEFYCFVDSIRGVDLLAAAAHPAPERRIGVLVEIGYPGGRAGCRTTDDALAVARAVTRQRSLRLAGVAGYEGLLGRDAAPDTLAKVTAYLRTLRAAAGLVRTVHDGTDEFLVSAGGSAYFDLVVTELASTGRIVLRSGSYVTHDDGLYEHVSPFARTATPSGRLEPALVLWAHVLSVPDPGRAIIGAGRRDLPFDAGLPRPRFVWRRGARRPAALRDATTAKVNDHHGYVDMSAEDPMDIGDLVGFGISHPCTAFDKWRLIPMLDPSWHVIGGVHTYF
jgi:D-serine deaminase-like pyridoxal phosphate-dependent protein